MSDQKYIVGVDLGGTSIKVGVVPYDGGKVLGMRSMPTNSDHGAKFVVDRMVEMIRGCMQDAAREEDIPEDGFIGIGLGSPGPWTGRPVRSSRRRISAGGTSPCGT